MSPLTLNAISLPGGISSYIPLFVVLAVLAVLFLVFKLVGVTARIAWRLLINGLIGVGMLLLFNFVFSMLLGMDFFHIGINWLSALVAGVFGIPGVIILLVIKYIV